MINKNNKKFSKVFKIIRFCFLFLFFAVIIYSLLFSVVYKIKNPKGLAMPFGFGVSLVLSGSMEPEITVDDLVFVKKNDSYQVGDIVLFNNGNDNVIHRIVKINGDIITTKGDANNTNDKPFSKDNILGVYTGKLVNGGKVIRFITYPPFIMSVMYVFMVFIFTWMFIDEKKKDKRIIKLKNEIDKIKKEIEILEQNNK